MIRNSQGQKNQIQEGAPAAYHATFPHNKKSRPEVTVAGRGRVEWLKSILSSSVAAAASQTSLEVVGEAGRSSSVLGRTRRVPLLLSECVLNRAEHHSFNSDGHN